ncbi:hypothetical protein TNCV_1458041 [Trichonephila clavipes]|nr:hypothetical protein TNCV_1458041 [Trichonephila clavipes]
MSEKMFKFSTIAGNACVTALDHEFADSLKYTCSLLDICSSKDDSCNQIYFGIHRCCVQVQWRNREGPPPLQNMVLSPNPDLTKGVRYTTG